VAVWSPLPPSPSGIADYVAEQLPELCRQAEVEVVVEDPAAVGQPVAAGVQVRRADEPVQADLHVYHLGNSPSHAYVYRAALERPGVAVLHEWSLHHLVLRETVERGDPWTYLREMRRAHGERGSFVGRQVARALGGDVLPALFPLSDRILERSLAIVGLTGHVKERAARRLPGRPVLQLPHHLSLPLDPLPTREQARASLGLPEDALLVTAPGLATASKGLDLALRALARLRAAHPSLRLVIAGDVDPRLPLQEWARQAALDDALTVTGRLALAAFVLHLCAADVVLALRFPSHGEISGALIRALGVGRPALVTAGTPSAEEFPEPIVIPVDPGPSGEDELAALLDRLLGDAGLRQSIGRLARDHVLRHHGLRETVERLVGFLARVIEAKDQILATIEAEGAPEGSLLRHLEEEVRWGARDLGLVGIPLGLDPLLTELVRERR
jgi:glycosyltransferase involved in cell wall biosynthesis